ncbi:MAG: recombination regulator RecX [Spirochaetaceae bacterium]|nr:recombination regulator RecX [Spirochaetaceae bacterium]
MNTLRVESVRQNRDIVSLGLDSGSVIRLSLAYLPPEYANFLLYPGAVLNEEAGAILYQGAACLAAEKAALRLIARAEQCAAGLERKLERRGHDPAAVRRVLGRLLELNLVNDGRYAALWLKSRISRDFRGPRNLEAALRARGINRETAKAALESALTEDAELKLLERCLKKARGKKNPGAGDIRFFLKTEGFSHDAIEQYFSGVLEAAPES